jgi:hypothetical protein
LNKNFAVLDVIFYNEIGYSSKCKLASLSANPAPKNFRKVNNNFFKYISGKIFEKEFIIHHKKKRVKFAKFK